MSEYVVYQHHHYGWTKTSHIAEDAQGALQADVCHFHPWLIQYGHKIEFKDDGYVVYYDGEPYPPAYYSNHPMRLVMGTYWFGDQIRIGQPDDCPECGGTGINHYNPFVQCWECGDEAKEGRGTGKVAA